MSKERKMKIVVLCERCCDRKCGQCSGLVLQEELEALQRS